MNLNLIDNILEREPKFRIKQVKKAIYQDLIEDWNMATTLPVFLREKLNEKCPLKINSTDYNSINDFSIKTVLILNDKQKVESVLMRHKDRNTICVSSQIGCLLGCTFCQTGKMGFIRNLNSYEIIEQVIYFSRLLKKENKKVTNIVFMGMGEPLLNYDNVIRAIRILNDKEGFNIGIRRISISTCGIIEGINKLSTENMDINLAVSIHSANEVTRSKIMPINKQYPIKKIIESVKEYTKKTRRKVMFEYLLLKDINDNEKDALDLALLLKGMLCMVNLINYNPTKTFQPSLKDKVKRFKEILENNGIEVTERVSFGKDIKAACGQLAQEKNYY